MRKGRSPLVFLQAPFPAFLYTITKVLAVPCYTGTIVLVYKRKRGQTVK